MKKTLIPVVVVLLIVLGLKIHVSGLEKFYDSKMRDFYGTQGYVDQTPFFVEIIEIAKTQLQKRDLQKNNTYYTEAISKGDATLCSRIDNPSSVLFCKREIAMKSLDSNKCASDDADCPDLILSEQAVKSKDINMCDQLSKDSAISLKEECYQGVAFATRDVANCKFRDPLMQFSCVVGVGILKNDLTVCVNVLLPYHPQNCEKYVSEKTPIYQSPPYFEKFK